AHLHIGCWRFEPDLGDPSAPQSLGTTEAVAGPRSPRGREDGTSAPLSLGGRGVGGEGAPTVGGLQDTEILLVRRLLDENTERFTQVAKPFNKNYRGQACEGSARWTPEEFTALRMES